MQTFNLRYLNHFNIKNDDEGLNEPSGLALSEGKNALWTISDDTQKIFKIALDGKLNKKKSFKLADDELEGIALDPSGDFLFVVKESTNEVIKIQLDSQQVASRQRLSDMKGYDAIAAYFADGGMNNGLEGITWNNDTGTLFVIKEYLPGLLIEISLDLKTILSHQLLDEQNGFVDSELAASEIDFSDICYDASRNQYWIVSDKAKRLFLYCGQTNQVISSAKLSYGKEGKYQEINKAEGIAIDTDNCRLYVVSDEEARLYVFDIRA